MSNTVANETLDAMCAVCGAHCATWVGEGEHGDRHYTLDACEDSGERFIVHSYVNSEFTPRWLRYAKTRNRVDGDNPYPRICDPGGVVKIS